MAKLPQRLAILFVWISTVGVGYLAGQDSMVQLVIDMNDRENFRAQVYETLLDASTRAISIVLREDAYLHERIRTEVPDWERIVDFSRTMGGR